MKATVDNTKKVEMTLGLLVLAYFSLDGQQSGSYYLNKDKGYNYNNSCTFKPFERYDRIAPTVKVGATYNNIHRDKFSDRGPGVEVLLEYEFKRKLFAELEVGMCSLNDYKAKNGALHYSAFQTNVGIGYRPVIRDGWALGGKLALGPSDEFFKERTGARTEKFYLNKLAELCVEKILYNGIGAGCSVSREFDRDMWRIAIRLIVKPETFKNRNNKHHNFPIKDTSR
jgi:hypothetical protein